MRDCLILGSGRSGTSMMGGILHDAGYYMGERLYPARDSNPKGFFENADVNGTNERILADYCDEPPDGRHTIHAPGKGQYWLMALASSVTVDCRHPEIEAAITRMAGHRPFAYKDPRFCYTLPVWQRLLPAETRYIVVFRSPEVTVASILKECAAMPYLASLQMDADLALEAWIALYRHALKHSRLAPGHFFFVHYEQLLDGSALHGLSAFLDVPLQHGFVDRGLNRSRPVFEAGCEAREVYADLCALAGYAGEGGRCG